MSNRTISLHLFILQKNSLDLLQFFDLDSDYNGDNGDEHWEMSDKKDKNGNPISLAVLEGYKTEAERILNKIDDQEQDDEWRIDNVINYVDKFCHGSYSSSWTYELKRIEEGYAVAVAYMY